MLETQWTAYVISKGEFGAAPANGIFEKRGPWILRSGDLGTYQGS